ncbi:FAD-binding and (Fe-S)-binding domain-containing protein [Cognataquiflexum rubidum]|uniref:FAD-binding and (Fe-S)-binding domain-containing protein n=1 Tax=Cognataquiflexum rubidum TaxID=2922273 RepID=UPI001F1307A2|nr:FAD-binding and (Fe-S)-binding domain-containing protein [Cognataquiflexum rubidum]MCH6233170.1 FAD-binding protein [Cognataquiflexum rubidum]
MAIDSSILSELKYKLKGDVLSDQYSLGMYATDASIYQINPRVVVIPKDEEDVRNAIKIAIKNNIKILPRGAGTSLAGQTVVDGMVLDFSKYMNGILECNVDERWVKVQPGVVRDVLNEYLAPLGLHFAPDPATSSRANVGGMVGNNSSGTKSILYGKTVDHVLEAKVLLADDTILNFKTQSPEVYNEIALRSNREGVLYRKFQSLINHHREEIKERFPKVMRRVGGYNLDEFVYTDDWNLAKLITGSEGTLATTLELKLNLVPLPKFKSVVVVHFEELLDAISAVTPMLEFNPSAIEILDRTVLNLSKENLTTKQHCHFIEGNPAAILIVEFYADSFEDVMERPEKMIRKLAELGLGYAFPLFPEGKAYEDVWIVRKKGLGLMLGIKGDKKPIPFIEDAAIPINVLPEYIDRVLKICEKHNTEISMYAHASVGVIHVRPILDLRQQQDIENLKKIADETFELVLEYGGSWSGEHGDGLVRSAYNERFFGPNLYQALKDVKQLFDPENLMNPGKIVEAQSIENNLRYGVGYVDASAQTQFKYKAENSFKESVHMCTGVGECRKIIGGTMCPSFKATRDEEHSTRGRANALRLAMSGQLDKDGLGSERLREAMDLCLSCKACKSECPSNVDMAKMKSDVSQLYYEKHGTTLRDRLIRDSSKMAAKFSGPFAGIINSIQKSGLFRFILQKAVGFDKRRTLPSYAIQPFYKWFLKNGHQQPHSSKKVVLFADTYLNFHEPQIGISAMELLNSCGYEVILANVGCCQRPKISHGFLKEAKSEGTKTVENLKKYFDQGFKVVVCEPSCASALNDDLPDLIDDQELANDLKANVMMIDVFLDKEIKAGKIEMDFITLSQDMLVHSHCHQKALYGTNSAKNIFANTDSLIKEIPSGCCGMAGSFGYETEHYDISKKIGEEVLFPTINKVDKHTSVIANGFSCRHQIAHFTQSKPKHWVESIKAIPKKNNLST